MKSFTARVYIISIVPTSQLQYLARLARYPTWSLYLSHVPKYVPLRMVQYSYSTGNKEELSDSESKRRTGDWKRPGGMRLDRIGERETGMRFRREM